MLFNSFQFLLFFPLVTLIYFLLPHRWRWLHLLLASCIFYCAFIPAYILILFFTILIDYVAGIWIEQSEGKKRKWMLAMSIIANVGVLAIFKYYNFFIANVDALLADLSITTQPLPLLHIILPIGLSFHTFQAMSYTIEVYRGQQKAERHLGIYALYVMFYPQLVAGPIERPQHIIHQFYERHRLDTSNLVKGLRLMLWGMFMKVVVADRLALYVDAIYENVPQHNGGSLALATFLFAIQIYCDFAGYSYIAIGAARSMGFRLMTNFRRPYLSTSVSEFWTRWHISLSSWFRDYLYFPLGGNRVKLPRQLFNLMFVFLVSGLWHGANWTFIIWGGLNGLYLIVEKVAGHGKRESAHTAIKWLHRLITFSLISFSWIFFRASSIEEAFTIVQKIVTDPGMPFMIWGTLFYGFIAILILIVAELKHEFIPARMRLANNPYIAIRYAYYLCMILIILLFGVFDGGQFIYFQF